QAMFPVILMCPEYWEGLTAWIKDKMLGEHDYIDADDLNVFTMADDVQTAVKTILDFEKGPGRSGIELPGGMKKA
ncbi:MAG: LOG family protein, partial [Phycisphaerales bacterium]